MNLVLRGPQISPPAPTLKLRPGETFHFEHIPETEP